MCTAPSVAKIWNFFFPYTIGFPPFFNNILFKFGITLINGSFLRRFETLIIITQYIY